MVRLTDSARLKVLELLAQTEPPPQNAGIRVGVRNGGCSGFSYVLSLDVADSDDEIFLESGVPVIVGRDSLRYVAGSEVDYRESFEASGFVVENPNVVSTCGCGSSFRVEDDGSPAAA